MQVAKPVGRNASALKYDILSAIGVMALAGDKHRQRLVMRLMVLITTRYNWQHNELSIGRAEIARLWSVDERTVKREMAKFRTAGWLEVKRAGAKGRVTVYALNLDGLLGDTRASWDTIGSDFVARMQERQGGAGETGSAQADPKVIPFQPRAPGGAAEGTWGRVLARLRSESPAQASTWFGQLSEMSRDGGRVRLAAPTRFVADYVSTHFLPQLLNAYVGIDPGVRHIEVTAVE